jgi:hypothetical protein
MAAKLNAGDAFPKVPLNLVGGGTVTFPVAFGATRADGDAVGAWWGEPQNIIQPAEFVIGDDGKVVISSYSSGPIGRMDADEVVKLVNFYEKRK